MILEKRRILNVKTPHPKFICFGVFISFALNELFGIAPLNGINHAVESFLSIKIKYFNLLQSKSDIIFRYVHGKVLKFDTIFRYVYGKVLQNI